MEQTTNYNILLVTILTMGLLLDGCALHPQRETPAQNNDGTTNIPAQPQTVTPDAAPRGTAHGGSAIGLSFPLRDQFTSPWPGETGLSGESPSSPVAEDESLQDDNNPDATEPSTETDSQSSANDATGEENENSDLWDRIRQGLAFPERQNARIDREAEWFSRHQAYLDRVADRAQPYLHYIVSQVEQRGMPSELALLPVVESAFQPYAYSSGRAAGIWQFVPDTGRRFGLKLNWWYDGRRDIVASTRAALDYLEYLHNTFDGDWLLALAAYNSGEGTVLKAIHYNQRHHRPTDYWSLRLPRETEQYVPRLLALREIVATPEKLGISLKPIADEAYLTSVKIESQLDLATAAKLADMDLEELHQLNPGFNRWATAPDGPHRLLLPLDKAALFATQVAGLSPEDRVHWVRHRVRRGETLSDIAQHYRTTVKVVADLNKIRGHVIHKGQYLIIPITSGSDPVHRVVHHASIPEEVASAGEKTLHTVAAGDSLWSLARRYGSSVQQLCRWNGISSRKLLRPGQKIIVDLGGTDDKTAGVIPASLHMPRTPQQVSKPRKITYTVRRGDSLSHISQRFSVTVQQVREWNDIKINQHLQPGQELTLYISLAADSESG